MKPDYCNGTCLLKWNLSLLALHSLNVTFSTVTFGECNAINVMMFLWLLFIGSIFFDLNLSMHKLYQSSMNSKSYNPVSIKSLKWLYSLPEMLGMERGIIRSILNCWCAKTAQVCGFVMWLSTTYICALNNTHGKL